MIITTTVKCTEERCGLEDRVSFRVSAGRCYECPLCGGRLEDVWGDGEAIGEPGYLHVAVNYLLGGVLVQRRFLAGEILDDGRVVYREDLSQHNVLTAGL